MSTESPHQAASSDGSKASPWLMADPGQAAVGGLLTEVLPLAGGMTLKVERPQDPEALLDLPAVARAYDVDGYMPYWASVWPVSRALARHLAEAEPVTAGRTPRVLELGCGIGLPGLAALARGWDVTFSDYDAAALALVARNAAAVGRGRATTLLMDWRVPPADTWDLVLAADLLYEARNLEPLVGLFARVLAPGGVVLVADPDRRHAGDFRRLIARDRWECRTRRLLWDDGGPGAGTLYELRREAAGPRA